MGLTPARPRESVASVQKRAFLAAAAASAGMVTPARAAQPPYVPAPPSIQFVRGVAPGSDDPGLGMSTAATDMATNTVYYTQPLSRFAKAHESFHVLDNEALTSADRLALEQAVGIGKGRWSQGVGLAGGMNSPDEIVADWYANAAVGNDPGGRHGGAWEDAYASPPSHKAFHAFERVLSQIARRRFLSAYRR
jgi:hypothetical protein